jgi:hypothetical protein
MNYALIRPQFYIRNKINAAESCNVQITERAIGSFTILIILQEVTTMK